MKVCRCCGLEKPDSEFHRSSRSKDGLNSMCKECKNIKAREYYRRRKEKENPKDFDDVDKEGWTWIDNICLKLYCFVDKIFGKIFKY